MIEGILPVPVDDNENPMFDRGSEVFTDRISGASAVYSGYSPTIDFKEVWFHVESGDPTLYISGTVTGSVRAILTKLGTNFSLPVVHCSGSGAAYGIALPSGTSGYISIIAWR